jgi:hypothetical protein
MRLWALFRRHLHHTNGATSRISQLAQPLYRTLVYFGEVCQMTHWWLHVFQPHIAILGLRQAPLLIVHTILLTLLYLALLSTLASSSI